MILADGDDLVWLQQWYASHCNGDWEHQWGVHFGTFDRDGWYLSIDLHDTKQRTIRTEWQRTGGDRDDWECHRFTNGTFEGIGGPRSLPHLLKVFRAKASVWPEPVKSPPDDPNSAGARVEAGIAAWLVDLYAELLSQSQSPSCSIKIETVDNPGWLLWVPLGHARLDRAIVDRILAERGYEQGDADNRCLVMDREKHFYCFAPADMLVEMLAVLKDALASR